MAFRMSQEFPTASLDITHNYYVVTELTFSYVSKHLACMSTKFANFINRLEFWKPGDNLTC